MRLVISLHCCAEYLCQGEGTQVRHEVSMPLGFRLENIWKQGILTGVSSSLAPYYLPGFTPRTFN